MATSPNHLQDGIKPLADLEFASRMDVDEVSIKGIKGIKGIKCIKGITEVCQHDYTFQAPPPDTVTVCETGTSYIRFCNVCGLEVERHEK